MYEADDENKNRCENDDNNHGTEQAVWVNVSRSTYEMMITSINELPRARSRSMYSSSPLN